jgi:hypothetical protein
VVRGNVQLPGAVTQLRARLADVKVADLEGRHVSTACPWYQCWDGWQYEMQCQDFSALLRRLASK